MCMKTVKEYRILAEKGRQDEADQLQLWKEV